MLNLAFITAATIVEGCYCIGTLSSVVSEFCKQDITKAFGWILSSCWAMEVRASSNPELGEYKRSIGSCPQVLHVSFSCFLLGSP